MYALEYTLQIYHAQMMTQLKLFPLIFRSKTLISKCSKWSTQCTAFSGMQAKACKPCSVYTNREHNTKVIIVQMSKFSPLVFQLTTSLSNFQTGLPNLPYLVGCSLRHKCLAMRLCHTGYPF